MLGGERPVRFDPAADCRFNSLISLPQHPNGLTFTAVLADGSSAAETYFSVGRRLHRPGGRDRRGGPSAPRSRSRSSRRGTCSATATPRPDHPGGRVAERAGLAHAGGDPSGAWRAIWTTMKAMRLPRMPHRAASCPAGWAWSGAPPGSAAAARHRELAGCRRLDRGDPGQPPGIPGDARVGQLLRAGRERGERRRSAGWSPRRPTGPRAWSRRCCCTTSASATVDESGIEPPPAHRRRDRQHHQEGGDDLRGDGRMPGRDRRLQRHGGGGADPMPRRLGRAGRHGGRDRPGAPPGPDLRSGGGAGPDPLHRAEHDGRGQGHHGVHPRARRASRPTPRSRSMPSSARCGRRPRT